MKHDALAKKGKSSQDRNTESTNYQRIPVEIAAFCDFNKHDALAKKGKSSQDRNTESTNYQRIPVVIAAFCDFNKHDALEKKGKSSQDRNTESTNYQRIPVVMSALLPTTDTRLFAISTNVVGSWSVFPELLAMVRGQCPKTKKSTALVRIFLRFSMECRTVSPLLIGISG